MRAISSLMGEKMGLGSAMTEEDRCQCLFRVLVECGGRVQRRRWAGSVWAPISAPFVTRSPSRWKTIRHLVKTAIVFQVRHLGGLSPESNVVGNFLVTQTTLALSYIHRGMNDCNHSNESTSPQAVCFGSFP